MCRGRNRTVRRHTRCDIIIRAFGLGGVTMPVRILKSLITAAAIVLCLAPTLPAQNLYGTLTGNVTDTSEAPVPGANVQVMNIETGILRDLVTNERGVYSFNDLQ